MKKQYTKKQIQEAISYWKKLLAKGDYHRMNESAESPEEEIRRAYVWGKTAGLCDGLVQISKAESERTIPYFDLFIFEYSDGTVTWVEKARFDGKFRAYPMLRKMNRSEASKYASLYRQLSVVASIKAEELGAVNESAAAWN